MLYLSFSLFLAECNPSPYIWLDNVKFSWEDNLSKVFLLNQLWYFQCGWLKLYLYHDLIWWICLSKYFCYCNVEPLSNKNVLHCLRSKKRNLIYEIWACKQQCCVIFIVLDQSQCTTVLFVERSDYAIFYEF